MAFSTPTDVGIRLGRELTAAENTQAEILLDSVTGIIADACGKDDDWAADLTPIPDALVALTLEVVARAISAPVGVRSQSLGQWSESYPDQLANGVQLTPSEERRARRIVFGSNAASSSPASVLDDLFDLTDPA